MPYLHKSIYLVVAARKKGCDASSPWAKGLQCDEAWLPWPCRFTAVSQLVFHTGF